MILKIWDFKTRTSKSEFCNKVFLQEEFGKLIFEKFKYEFGKYEIQKENFKEIYWWIFMTLKTWDSKTPISKTKFCNEEFRKIVF